VADPTLPRDIVAVSFDETRNYTIDPADRPFIDRILGVYILDRSSRTFCCESTPSYDLRHVYDTVVVGVDCPEDVADRLDATYAHNGGDDIYVHCRVIEALPVDRIRVWGGDDPTESDAEAMESAREHFQGNCPF